MRPRTLVGRLFVWQVAVVLGLLAALGFVLDRRLEDESLDSLTVSLVAQARTVSAAIETGDAPLQTPVAALGAAADVRITVIAEDGEVLAESERDPADLENHAGRPEVRAALAGQIGVDERRSESVGVEFLYVAIPPEDGRIVRVAAPLTRVRARQTRIRWIVGVGLLATAVAASGGVLLVSRGVAGPVRRLTSTLERADDRGLPPRVDPAGAAELVVLAESLNSMSERLRTQMLAAEHEQRTRDVILSSMEEGVLLADARGAVTFSNTAAERHLGTRPRTLDTLSPLALRRAALEATTSPVPGELEVETGSPPRWLRCSFVRVDEAGSLLVVVRDVTQSRRLESVRRDFVTNASHELKTPVASIRAAAETIANAAGDDPAVIPVFAERVERDAIRLSRIVSDLLDLSRLESGAERGERVALDIVVREEADRFTDAAEAANVRLSVDAAQSVRVLGSERDLRLLVRNLVDNAVRYTGEGGQITVRLGREDGSAVLHVADSGIGIPSRDVPRIFERFYRVDRGRSRDTGGTGLGLSIVRHVVENHGGTVSVESELGLGATFEVRLPAGP